MNARAFILSAGIILQPTLSATALAQNRRRAGEELANQTFRSIVTPIDVPDSLPKLIELSTVIILGTGVTEMPARRFVAGNSESDVVTDRVVRVDQVLKGQLKAQKQVAVEELGGSLTEGNRSVTIVVVHQNPIREGGRYLLFLRPTPQPVGDQFEGNRYVVTGIWAGSFQLVNGQVRISDGDQPALRAMDGMPENSITSAVRNAIAAAGR
jgi:hypothetical protein